MFDVKEHTHYLVMAGSHSYGMARPESDIDVRGWAIPPREYFLSYHKHFEQTDQSWEIGDFPWFNELAKYAEAQKFKIPANDPIDSCIYGIQKFVKLAANCNPNIIELLYVDEEDILHMSLLGAALRRNRDLFLTARAHFTFTGYAVAQLKRINTHRRWLLNPPGGKPTRADFGLPERTVIPADQREAANKLIEKQVRLWLLEEADIDRSLVQNIQGDIEEAVASITAGQDFREAVRQAAGERLGMSENFIDLLQREKRYKQAKTEWSQHQSWVKNRNPARAELEAEHGYDCYLDSETEFLTNSGFKKYDNICTQDLLATVNPQTHALEFQGFMDRVKKPYKGTMYDGETQNTSFCVTDNHRMFVSNTHRQLSNNFSVAYIHRASSWHYTKMSDLLNGKRGVFHVLHGFDNTNSDAPISDDKLRIIGCYLSDGCLIKHSNGTLKGVSISQLDGGRLCEIIESISEYKVHKHPYKRKGRVENTYNIYSKELANWLLAFCGEYAKSKRMDSRVFDLSQRQAALLLDVMIKGDGTNRKHSNVYYTSSKELSDWVQIIGLLAGKTTQQWPYIGKHSCDQIYLSDKQKVGNLYRSQHIREVEVDDYIVCFTVRNENLVTRRNGKIAIQGNTKHASHLVRLLLQAVEILSTGNLTLKNKDRAEHLLSIRRGAWSYEQLMEWTSNVTRNLETLYKQTSCPVPKKPNVEKIDELMMDIVQEDFNEDGMDKAEYRAACSVVTAWREAHAGS